MAVFAFMAVQLGEMLLRTGISNAQPTNTDDPTHIASIATKYENFLIGILGPGSGFIPTLSARIIPLILPWSLDAV